MSYDHRTRRIDQIPDAVDLNGADEFAIWQAGRTRKITLQELIDKLPSTGGGGDGGGGTTPGGYVLPRPTASTLGGVLATAPVAGKFVRGIDTATGNLLLAEPTGSGGAGSVYAGTVDITKAPYNADPTGAVDATAAFNTAFADPLVKAVFGIGDFKVTGQIDMPSPKALIGIRRLSRFVIPKTFSTSAQGVVKFQALESGPMISGWDFAFEQDDVPYAQLKQYPPAIFARDCPRFKIDTVRIERAWIGIDMQGNSGGAILDEVEGSSFFKFCIIDGSLDSVKINKMHFWPFGLLQSTNHFNAYKRKENVGLEAGRCDDLKIAESIFFCCVRGVYLKNGTYGNPSIVAGSFGNITGTDFDESGGLYVEGGDTGVTNCTFTVGGTITGAPAIYVGPGAQLRMTGGKFYSAANTTNDGFIQVVGDLQVTGTMFLNEVDQVIINCIGQGEARLTVVGCQFRNRQPISFNYHRVMFNLNSGTFVGNTMSGEGQGVFVSASGTARVSIDGNFCHDFDIQALADQVGFDNKKVKGGKSKRTTGIATFTDGQAIINISTALFPSASGPTPSCVHLTMQSTSLGAAGPPWSTLSGNNSFGINCPGSGSRSVSWSAE